MYVKNNIYFRAISSHCIERFKNSQAALLTNVIDKKKYNFNETAIELLNISFDQWFRWLTVVEKFFLEASRIGVSELNYIISLADRRLETIEILVLSHPDVFDPKFVKIWFEVHNKLHEFFKVRIDNLITKDTEAKRPELILPFITNNLIQILNNTLFELHEIDNLIYNKGLPFVSFEEMCIEYASIYGHCILKDRLNIYNNNGFNIKEIYIKNYYDGIEEIPNYIYTELKSIGISIVHVE
jgi:hypothetical protein